MQQILPAPTKLLRTLLVSCFFDQGSLTHENPIFSSKFRGSGISGLMFRSITRLAKGIALLIPLKLADPTTISYADEYAYPDGFTSNPKNRRQNALWRADTVYQQRLRKKYFCTLELANF